MTATRFCMECGAERTAGLRFCPGCGSAFAGERGASAAGARPAWRTALGWAGPLPLLFFFLPWITVSCQTMPMSETFSGYVLAAGGTAGSPFGPPRRLPGETLLFIVPLAALGLLGLRVVEGAGYRAPARSAARGAAESAAAGASLIVIVAKYAAWSQDVQRASGGLVALSPNVGLVLSVLAFGMAVAAACGELVAARGAQDRPAMRAAMAMAPTRGGGPSERAISVAAPAEGEALRPRGTAQAVLHPVTTPAPFCPQCGARAVGGGNFCVECGEALG